MRAQKLLIRCWLYVSVLLISTHTVFSEEQAALSPIQQAVKTELQAFAAKARSKPERIRSSSIIDHYSENGYQPLWLINGQFNEKAKTIITQLVSAKEHGLDPRDYPVAGTVDPSKPEDVARFDIRLSNSLVSYAQHLNAGRLDPRSVTRENVIYPDKLTANEILAKARATNNIAVYLRLLAPHTPRYERLRLALRAYRKMAAHGGWPAIPKGENKSLKPGMEDLRVPMLRKRLAISGDYLGDVSNPATVYDGDIIDAVIEFQRRHGLAEDGVIGPNTLAELNTTVEERIAILEYNLERRRWMQDDYGPYYVFANLADQVLKVVRNGKTVHAELIQVGLPYHRTPVFTDEMEYIEINPYWNVPKSIAVNEMLPKLKRNPGAFSSQGFEVLRGGSSISPYSVPWNSYSMANFPVRLRQNPGTKNALGRIKFMFPNNFNVYIHDTPSKSKFDRTSRYFSHGCLRLKDPLTMAQVLLEDQGWSRQKIDATVASKKRTIVKLNKNIPVHIAYMTAWVNKDGSVHFRRDVYGRDKILGKALERVSG